MPFESVSKNFIWWQGFVEDVDDPLKLGRCRVRIVGYHTPDISDDGIPTQDLPWAVVMQPTTSAAASGVGSSPHGIVPGSWVIGFFRDGNEAQQPVIFGTFAGLNIPDEEGNLRTEGKGFNDPNQIYPKDSYGNQSDVNKLARNEDIENTIVKKKQDDVDKGNPTALGGGWDEPPTPYKAEYPKNKVYESESGHVIEIDDTPGAERLHKYHKSGTFEEIHPDGTQVEKVFGNNYQIVKKDNNVSIYGDATINIGNTGKISAGKNFDMQIEGEMKTLVVGDVTIQTSGNLTHKVLGRYSLIAGGGISLVSPIIDMNPVGVNASSFFPSATTIPIPGVGAVPIIVPPEIPGLPDLPPLPEVPNVAAVSSISNIPNVSAVSSIGSSLGNIASGALDVAGGALSAIGDFASGALDTVGGAVTTFSNAVGGAVSSGIGAISSVASGAVGFVSSSVSGISTSVASVGSGVASIASPVTTLSSGALSTISSGAGPALSSLSVPSSISTLPSIPGIPSVPLPSLPAPSTIPSISSVPVIPSASPILDLQPNKFSPTTQPTDRSYNRIRATATKATELISTEAIPLSSGEGSIVADQFEGIGETEITTAEGVPGPQGPIGPVGPPGESLSWDTPEETTATNLEGIPPGTTFDFGTPTVEILKAILYPEFLGFQTFSIGVPNGSPNYEIGQTANAGEYTAEWTINDIEKASPNSIIIKRSNDVLISDYPVSSSFDEEGLPIENGNNVQINHPDYRITSGEGEILFTISLTGNNGNPVSKTDSIRWNFPIYYGKFLSNTITNQEILSNLTKVKNKSLQQMTSGLIYTVAEEDEGVQKFLYWISPKGIGTNLTNLNYDPNTSFVDVTISTRPQPIPMIKNSDVTINTNGIDITYEVYCSSVAFGGGVKFKAQP